ADEKPFLLKPEPLASIQADAETATPMVGTIAITDEGWYRFLADRADVTELNFWTPSARRTFRAPQFSPFLFKLRSPLNAICESRTTPSSHACLIGSLGNRLGLGMAARRLAKCDRGSRVFGLAYATTNKPDRTRSAVFS